MTIEQEPNVRMVKDPGSHEETYITMMRNSEHYKLGQRIAKQNSLLLEGISVEDTMNTQKCWLCNREVLLKRIEKHHIMQKLEETLDLCIICHDLVDRQLINLEALKGLAKVQNCDYEVKLLFLKLIKCL